MRDAHSVAIHEAAHAVIAEWFGYDSHGAIIKRGKYGGWVGKAPWGRGYDRPAPEEIACIALAGPCAEIRVDPDYLSEIEESGLELWDAICDLRDGCADYCADDHGNLVDEARALWALMSGFSIHALRRSKRKDKIVETYRLCEAKTDAILNRPEVWSAIETVATKLAARKKVDQDCVKQATFRNNVWARGAPPEPRGHLTL